MFTPRVLNRSATPCLGLEVFEVSNLRRCRTHGSTVFAPVVRGEDPDREAALRTASEHSADRGEDRPGQVHGEPRAEARPVVRVQRERVVPPLPAETAEDGRIRRYLPKRTSLDGLTDEDLQAIVQEINDTPMKAQDWETPNEVWYRELGKLMSKTSHPQTNVALTNR